MYKAYLMKKCFLFIFFFSGNLFASEMAELPSVTELKNWSISIENDSWVISVPTISCEPMIFTKEQINEIINSMNADQRALVMKGTPVESNAMIVEYIVAHAITPKGFSGSVHPLGKIQMPTTPSYGPVMQRMRAIKTSLPKTIPKLHVSLNQNILYFRQLQMNGDKQTLQLIRDDIQCQIKDSSALGRATIWSAWNNEMNRYLMVIDSLLQKEITQQLHVVKTGTLEQANEIISSLKNRWPYCIQAISSEYMLRKIQHYLNEVGFNELHAANNILAQRQDYQQYRQDLQWQKLINANFQEQAFPYFSTTELPFYQEIIPHFKRLELKQLAECYQKRFDALSQMIHTESYTAQSVYYDLPKAAQELLSKHKNLKESYELCYGNQLQQVVHQECIALIDKIAVLSPSSVWYNYQDALLDCIHAASDFNKLGLSQHATPIIDFCWTLLEYGKAIAEGVASGATSAINDMIDHPVETVLCSVAGEYLLAYQLSKIVHNVCSIAITSYFDPSEGRRQWEEYIAPISKIIQVCTDKELKGIDIVKGAAHFAANWKMQSALLHGLHSMFSQAKQNATRYAQQFPDVFPDQYAATPEGFLVKTTYKIDKPEIMQQKLFDYLKRSQKAEVTLAQNKSSIKAILKKNKLPVKGKIRFIPPKNWHSAEGKLRKNILNGRYGFVDKFGNVWVQGESRTVGQPFEWDVQLSSQGKQQLGWMTRDNSHLNVSLDGEVTHK